MKNSYLKKTLLSIGILLFTTITIKKLSAADENNDTEVKAETTQKLSAADENNDTEVKATATTAETTPAEETTADSTPDDSINIPFSKFEKLQKIMQKVSEHADVVNKDFNDWITEITTTDTATGEADATDTTTNK